MRNEDYLFNYCRWGQVDKITEFLKEHPDDIDITFSEGVFFELAITEESDRMLCDLLQYFDNKRPKFSGDRSLYVDAYHKFKLEEYFIREILAIAREDNSVPKQIRICIENYFHKFKNRDEIDNNSSEDLDENFEESADDPLSEKEHLNRLDAQICRSPRL